MDPIEVAYGLPHPDGLSLLAKELRKLRDQRFRLHAELAKRDAVVATTSADELHKFDALEEAAGECRVLARLTAYMNPAELEAWSKLGRALDALKGGGA